MAHSVPCYLPKFGATHQGPQRPLSMRLRVGASQSAGLLSAWNEGHLNALLQAAWALLLHRYTGSEDICFGYHQIGGDGVQSALQQPLDSADPSIFKLSISEDDTLKTFLDHVKTHSYFDNDLDRSKPLITTSNTDLPFNTILMIRICHDLKGNASIPQLPSLFPIALPEKCRIRLQAKVLQEEVGIFFEWWNNDMPTEQVKSIAGVFEHIVAELLSAHDAPLDNLDIFPENDWARVCKFNSVLPEKHERCIHDAIYEQAILHPDHEAVCAWDGSLSYQELDDLSSKVAFYLQKRGVGPEVCVALCFEKSKWNIVAMVGVLKAGGAFVPMDPTHPTARLQSLVQGVQARNMLCSRNYAEKLQTVAEVLLPLDLETVNSLPSPNGTVSSATVKSSNAAYVIFTSGSTGEPKGTLLEHGAYFSSAMAHGPVFHIDTTTRILQFAAHTFDASLVDILTGLMFGACVCIPSEEARLTDIAGVINDMRIDYACLTPSFIGFLEPSAVPGLKTLVLAGEAMSPSHLATWSHLTLVNGYGPTESSVTAALNMKLSATSDCRDIGQPIGVRWWVVNPKNHDQLAPIGCPGELVLEGPTLARCYINDPQKTNDAFIYDPAWTKRNSTDGSRRRFYKTGDLVRYSSVTGSLTYIGRKDTQVKFHGQRIELGEIENQLSTDVDVKHCLALLPKAGFSQGKLVAVLSLAAGSKNGPESDAVPLKLLEHRVKTQYVKDIRERLSARLPTYMVPSVWLCVETMPMLVSGKLDRKSISAWVSGMAQDPDMPTTGPTETRSVNVTEDQLASIWSRLLNIPKNRISLNESFLSLGGDSIAAITCVGQCKKQGIGLTVQEILRSKSIRELATRVKEVQQPAAYHEKIEEPFDLSPIQKLHFMVRDEGQGYFNQSVLTRIDRRIDDRELRRAVDAVVMRHSMLRSRLVDPETGGPLQQRITEDVAGSYRWRTHTTASQATIEKAVAGSQLCINAFVGPMFAVDFFYANNSTHNFLSLVAHHLAVDIVSWRIILEDLEDYLNDPQAFTLQNSSLPFQTWCHLQNDQCRSLLSENELQLEDLPAPDLAYWGMETRPMTYGDVVCETFEVDADSTQSILLECHESLRTEPVEVFLAALLHSFGQTFSDRALPVIYNEGHGREAWDPSIDISRTVGWFTTLYPIFVSDIVPNDPARTVARVKDLRRQVSDNGRQKFASRMFTGHHHCPLEMSFNYVGQHRDLQKQDGLFQLTGHMAGETGRGGGAADFGEETPRFALLEISALVVQGRLRFTFSFNRFMHRQERIRDWISRCQQLLGSLGQQLQSSASKPTLSDYPMLSLTYEELDKMVLEKLPSMGIDSLDLVEDIYPCSRMQQGILISQSRDNSFYAVHDTFEVRGFRTKPDIDQLRLAWQKVVSCHSILRTIFVQNLTSQDLFSQVVLKETSPSPNLLTCLEDSDVLTTFESHQPMDYRQHCPAHRLTLCQTASGKLFCRLEISHAAMDGMSISLIVRDLQLAYSGKLEESRKPMFKNYMKYLQSCSHKAGLEYWCNYLADIKPCHFPVLNDGKSSIKQLHTIRLNFASLRDLQTLCESGGVTLSTAFSTAWGLTLRSFCSSDDVCFSYMASLRDVAVEDIDSMIGPIINLLACRIKITEQASLKDVLDQVQNDYMESLPYRHTSLIDIQHALKLSDTILFNSGVSYRKLPPQDSINRDDIRLVEVGSIHDPAEFPVYVNIEATDHDAQIDLHYWTDALSDGQAQNVASAFIKSLENIIHCQDDEVHRLDGLSEQNKQQIAIWNKHMPKPIDKCVHEVLEEKASSYPDATALSASDGSITYSKLNELSALLAFYLTKLGVGPGVLVPMNFERSSWQIIATLAVLRLGGICLPLAGTQSDEFVENLLFDHDVQVALVSPSKAQLLEGTIPYVVPVSKSLFDYLPRSGETLASSVKPTDDAYVVFPAGSLDGPEPVVLDHCTILTRAEAFASALELSETTKMLQFAAYTSDMFLQEVLGSLLRGGRVSIPADDNVSNLSASINTSHANTLSLTPSLASLIKPSDVPEVHVLAVYGEGMTNQVKNVWSSNARLHSWYGAAECSSTCIHTSDSSGETRAIGRAAGCNSWLVDPTDHNLLVPIGCIGELVLEGPILASGYLLEEERPGESFIEDPVWSLLSEHDKVVAETDAEVEIATPARRMFKTGDLARYESDGSLVYIGKKDMAQTDNWHIQQHLDSFLLPEHPSVLELVRSDNETEAEQLAVFIQFKSASSTNVAGQNSPIGQSSPEFYQLIAKLHTHLLSVLPAVQVPNLYIPVPSMPLTPLGKLDYQLLRRETESLPSSVRREFDLKSFHEFWRTELAKPSTALQTFLPARSVSQGTSINASLRKDTQLSGKLNGADLESAILAAWALTIYGYTGSEDIIFGELHLDSEASTLASADKASATIVPRRFRIDATSTISELFRITKEKRVAALPYQKAGLQRIKNVSADTFRACGFNNLFSFAATQKDSQSHTALEYPLAIFCSFDQSELQLNAQYDDQVLSAPQVERILSQLTSYIEYLYFDHSLQETIADIPLLKNQHSYLSSPDTAYWKEYLADVEICHFPSLNAGEDEKSVDSARLTIPDVVSIFTFCEMVGVTADVLLQIVWALTLRCFTGLEEVCFGYYIEATQAEDSKSAQVLPSRFLLQDTSELREIAETRENELDQAIVHPLLESEVQHELGLDVNSLFNTIFKFDKARGLANADDNLFSKSHIVEKSSCILGVNAKLSDTRAEIVFEYATDALSKANVESLVDTYKHILLDLIDHQQIDRTIGDVDFFNEYARQKLQGWNGSLPARPEICAHEIIEQQVLSHPTSPAICSWDADFTYEEVDILSTRLAQYLAGLGVKPEVFVAMCFEKSAWAVIAQVAVMKAGGAFAFVDPTHPEARLKGLVEDLGASIVLCSTKYFEKASTIAQSAFVVSEETMDQLFKSSSKIRLTRPSIYSPAYAIFTSGTTGKPKVTVLEHICLSGSIEGFARCGLNSDTRALQFSSYTFDVSIMETMIVLMTGGCICIPSEEERMNDLTGAINRLKANYISCTPSIANTLDPADVPSLRAIVTGGEKMPPSHLERWSGICVINAYGPSEATVMATMSVKVDPAGVRLDNDCNSIGTAISGRTWVVDPENYHRLLPIGAVGELLLEGCNVGRGYLNNEQKTKEVFVGEPAWSKMPGLQNLFPRKERMYRTGDLVRYKPDGSICFISRKDTQIKFNGQRIELEEIEQQCITCLPEDAHVAVDVVNPETKAVAKSIAAFFTFSEYGNRGTADDSDMLVPMSESTREFVKKFQNALAQILPPSMMPKLFFPIRRLPYSTSGKLDRKKLRAVVETLPKEQLKPYVTLSTTSRQASDDGIEGILRSLWEEALGLASGSVSAEDSFFSLGGDSFSAIKLVGAANSRGISLTFANIYEDPIFMDMAKRCDTLREKPNKETVTPFSLLPTSTDRNQLLEEVAEQCCVPLETVTDIYPCSPVQEGLLTLSVKQNGAYVAQPVFRLSERVNLEKFKAAWQHVVDEMEILRTRVVHTESLNFLQAVIDKQEITWTNAATLDELMADSPDLPKHNGGVLTDYAIVGSQASPARYFVWTIHHALYDGWSIPLVLKRLEEIYNDFSAGSKTLPYGLFIEYLLERNMSDSDEFWKSQLANLSSAPFPQSKNSLPDAVRVGNRHQSSMKISRAPGGVGLTVPELIRAAWAVVVAAHTGSSDVCFGETLMGRNIDLPGVTDIAGPVLTTVPTRIQVENELPIIQYLESVHHLTTTMLPHQHSGLQRIRKLNSDTASACEFQNLLVIQTGEGQLNENLWMAELNQTSGDFFTHPLVVECKVGDSEVTVTMHHDEMVLNSWQTEKLIGQFSFVLEQLLSISKAETRKLSELEIFSPVDRNEVALWNQRHPGAVEQCAHDIIFERCSAHPDAPAVCAWDGEVSYREMYDLASSFATYLVSRGIGPETLVPICLDKSLWAVITILGIFIAGGAYVPLDPAHPTSRHEEILTEVDARVVLCSPQYHNRYSGIVKTIIPVSKETVKAYSALDGNVKRSNHVTPSNMAYAIFTSGSTGRAKGIIIDHRALSSSVMAFGPLVGLTETSRAFQFASLTFDAAVMEVLATLMHGGCICIPSEDERLNDVAGAIRRMNVTWTFLTPSIASIIEPSSVPSLEVLVCGGEKLSREVVTKWAHRVRLINGYGPTETTIFAVLNTEVSSNRDASCIGFGLPCTLTWIVDPDNHDRLAPLGAIGELALEGPALAREYLKNPQKTAEAFVDEPAWIKNFQSSLPSPRRIYKTGDLVRYNPDGSVEYISRKDHQVKLHGQRMELGEIEHRLYEDDHVRHAVVILPKTGPLQQRLVTVLSLNSLNSDSSIITDNTCELISPEDLEKTAYSELIAIQKNLEAQLPIYMVPQTWALIKKLPMLVSGKLDRKKITHWVEHIDEATYERIMQDYDNIKRGNVEESFKDEKETSVSILQDIYAQVLNLPPNKIDPNRSFVSLGGDSITGMAVISRARKQGINLTLHKILQSKSIGELTRGIETKASAVQLEEKSGEQFSLSPIQGLYFQAARTFKGTGRFNQSMTVRITRKVESNVIKNALKAIISQHSMFRAKFTRSGSGKWQQKITSDIDASYRFGVHSVNNPRQMLIKIGETQSSLDIQNGPIFAADLFEIATGEQVLFLVANHLCVDMVSWRIVLQDMQEFIESGSLPSEKPLSFQAWCDLQFEKSKSEADVVQLPFAIEPSNISYWGMDGLPNLYGQIKMESFSLDEKTTSFILGRCHETLRTETIDILLAAVVQSFRRVFKDRNMPTIYNEGHGRESWDSSIDLSRTVGWFTTMCPLQVDEGSDFIDTAKRMKDVRRKMVDNGRSYFAHSLLHSSEAKSASFPAPLEIVFNYLGRLQQLERDDSLFQHYGQAFDQETFKIAGDMGPDTPRFALLEISALIVKDKLQVSFTYNRQMQREEQIHSWISECRNVLETDVLSFKDVVPEPSLSDFPLLPITYDGLRRLVETTLPRAGIDSWDKVEDIYPCSSVQEGILLSQLRDPNAYMFHVVFEVSHSNTNSQINPARLQSAWSAVVSRHPILRTRFIDSNHAGGSFDQLVLRNVDERAIMIESNDSNTLDRLDAIKLSDINARQISKSLHQLTICQTQSGRVLVKIEMNHAIIDGGSVDLILRDLAMAYNDQLPEGSGPLFSDYIKFIRGKSQDDALTHWRQYLSNARPCHLTFPAGANSERQLGSVMVPFNRYSELQQFCEKNSVTLANLTLSAWAIVLQAITGSNDVCFGYPSAGRDAPVPGIQDAVGIFLNMLCCRVKFSHGQTLLDLSKTVQSDYIKNLPYQDCSLASIQHELAQKERMLFNTTISIQNHHAASKDSSSDMLSYNVQKAHDPTEYPVTVNVETAKGHEGILLRYWTDAVPENKAQDLADAIANIFESFIDKSSQLVSDLELLGRSRAGPSSGAGQYIDNKTLQELIDRRVTEVITQMLRDGTLTFPVPQPEKSHTQETAPFTPLKVPIQARRMPRERDMSDSTATLTEEHTRTSDLEKRLWKLWCSALHLTSETPKHRESFFKLGGDSITAMKMVSAAREDGLTLTVADVFSNPVFEDMLAIISAANSSPASEPASHTDSEIEKSAESSPILQQEQTPPPPEFSFLKAVDLNDNALQSGICPKIGVFKGGIADVLPVTDFQAMSITATLFRSRWMVNYFFLDGRGTVDLKRLRESFLRVVDAFDILRTVFVCFNGQFYQVVLRKIRPNIFVHETEKSLDEYTDYLQQQDRQQEARQGEQYVQFYVLKKKGSNHHRILIRMSHAQFDGVCLPTIMSAIKLGYEGSPLPPAPSFANYMRMLSGAITPDHYQHWTNLLRGSSMTQVIRRSETNAFQHIGAFTDQRKMLEIQPSVLDNITIATVMQAAWAVTLAKLSAQSDVVFGLTITGRNTSIPGIENTVGPCLNVIPVRVKFGERWTGLDLFRYLQDQQIANMPFEALGFREIIRRCTDWPDSTYYTTSVFHQNVEYEGEMQLDSTTYRQGGVGVVDNFTDITLFSKSTSDGKLGVSLGYSLKGPIQPKLATKILNMVCDTVQSLVSNARVVLPSPSMLSSLPCQAVHDVPRMSDEMFLSANLKTRSISEILVHSDVLTKAWQQVLPRKDAETPQSAFQLDSSFFDLGGDVFDVAQIVWLLEQDGLQVHLEDLLEHPSFLGQMAVLALHNSPKSDSMEEILPVDGVPLPVARTGTLSSFGKALTLAKRVAKWSSLSARA